MAESRYSRATEAVIDACKDATVLRVCLRLATWADFTTGKDARPAIGTLAVCLSMTPDGVRQSLKRAVAAGYLRANPRATNSGASAPTSYDCLWYQWTATDTLASRIASPAGEPSQTASLSSRIESPSPAGEPTLASRIASYPRQPDSQSDRPDPTPSTNTKARAPRAPKAEQPEPMTQPEMIAIFREWLCEDAAVWEGEKCWIHWRREKWLRKGKPVLDWKATCRLWAMRALENGARGANPPQLALAAASPQPAKDNPPEGMGWHKGWERFVPLVDTNGDVLRGGYYWPAKAAS